MMFLRTLNSLNSERMWVLAFNNNIFQIITAFQQVVVSYVLPGAILQKGNFYFERLLHLGISVKPNNLMGKVLIARQDILVLFFSLFIGIFNNVKSSDL